jgi:hypothetical protein
MTRTPDPTTITTNEQEGSADPRPAWERIAYTWLAREVDGGQPVDPATLPAEVSVALDLARDLLRLLRAQQNGDPGLGELRARLVRDRITDAYLRRELAGGRQLDPAALAAEVGTTTAIARQWLGSLRHQQLLAFTRRLVAFRRAHPVFRRCRFLVGIEAAELAWFTPRPRR